MFIRGGFRPFFCAFHQRHGADTLRLGGRPSGRVFIHIKDMETDDFFYKGKAKKGEKWQEAKLMQ